MYSNTVKEPDWSRHTHPDFPSVVETCNRDIFIAAAAHPAFEAVVLEVSDQQLEQERKIISGICKDPAFDEKTSYASYFCDLSAGEEELRISEALMPTSDIVLDMSHLYDDITDDGGNFTEIIRGWREQEPETSEEAFHAHDDYPVINRVFGSSGSVVKTRYGLYRTAEGSTLFIPQGQLHAPEFLTEKNAEKDRFTLGTHKFIGLEV